ncbi:MAG: hypothetical protein MUF66_05905 [Gammaproteobacteria bacterium]|nr:hypothetical protein [Gammaproteobacteria bacterium]
MPTRKTNYAFERNQRAKAKAAKRQAKLQAKTAKPRDGEPQTPGDASDRPADVGGGDTPCT